jgi:hypothetical protein
MSVNLWWVTAQSGTEGYMRVARRTHNTWYMIHDVMISCHDYDMMYHHTMMIHENWEEDAPYLLNVIRKSCVWLIWRLWAPPCTSWWWAVRKQGRRKGVCGLVRFERKVFLWSQWSVAVCCTGRCVEPASLRSNAHRAEPVKAQKKGASDSEVSVECCSMA